MIQRGPIAAERGKGQEPLHHRFGPGRSILEERAGKQGRQLQVDLGDGPRRSPKLAGISAGGERLHAGVHGRGMSSQSLTSEMSETCGKHNGFRGA
eukprot:13519825-Alexandrium_andersonii.AAC.1